MEQDAGSRPRPGSRRPSHHMDMDTEEVDSKPDTTSPEQTQPDLTVMPLKKPLTAEPDALKTEAPPSDPNAAQAEGQKLKDEAAAIVAAAAHENKPPIPARKASKDRPEQHSRPAEQHARPDQQTKSATQQTRKPEADAAPAQSRVAGPRAEEKQDNFAARASRIGSRLWYGEQQGSTISSGADDAARLAYLERRVRQLENRPSIDQYNTLMQRFNAQNKGLVNVQSKADRLTDDKQSLLITNRNLQHELLEEKEQVKILQETLQQQQRAVAKVHSNATNLLAQDVAAKMPDDKARRAFRSLFDGDILGWCMEYKTELISDTRAVKLLEEAGVLADQQTIPPAQRLDITSSTASAVLLEAALARDLCDAFLEDPFFLNSKLLTFEADDFRKIPDNPVVTWRIRTCEFLEAAFPPDSNTFAQRAEAFASRYAYLLDPLDDTALAELADLYERFCRIALQLWKRKALIQVEGLGERQGLKHFHSGDAEMEAHASVQHELGSTRLDGRPIHVLVRPRIVAEPILNSGRSGSRVVWSNAVVWVSNHP